MKSVKKVAIIVSAVLCTAAVMCGCNGNKEPQNKEPVEQERIIDFNKPAFVVKSKSNKSSMKTSDEPEAVEYSSEIGELDIYTAADGNRDATKKINERMEIVFKLSKTASDKFMKKCLEAKDIAPWSYESSYEVVRNDGYALSVEEYITANSGTSGTGTGFTAYNFDSQTGDEIVGLEGLMGKTAKQEPEMFKALGELIYQNIALNYTSQIAQEIPGYIQYTEEGTREQLVELALGCWSFDGANGINIVYNAGVILPQVEGDIKVKLTADELIEINAALADKYFKQGTAN